MNKNFCITVPVEARVKFILAIDVETQTSLELYIFSVEINPT